MSAAVHRCSDCDVESTFEGSSAFPAGAETTYAVAWVCPNCDKRTMDICPVPLIGASGEACINCGTSITAGSCAGCGCRAPSR